MEDACRGINARKDGAPLWINLPGNRYYSIQITLSFQRAARSLTAL